MLLGVLEGAAKISQPTREAYTLAVERFLAFAGQNPASWTPRTVEAWRDYLSRGGLSPPTVNKHLYALRYVCKRREALGDGADFARSAESLRAPREKKRQAMTIEEVSAVVGTCALGTPPDLRDRAAIAILLASALRSSNVASLRYESLAGVRLDVIQKGARPHSPVLDAESLEDLRNWSVWLESKGKRLTGPIFRSIRKTVRDTYEVGAPILSREWLNRMLQKRALLAGISRSIHPHLFRHTAISWWLDKGVPPARIMAQTGQVSLATLAGYYSDRHAEENPIAAELHEYRPERRR